MTESLALETRLATDLDAAAADAVILETNELLVPSDEYAESWLGRTGDGGALAIATALRESGGRLDLGSVVAVPGGITGADHVVLVVTVAPSLERRARGWPRTEAYLSALDQAVALRARSVALGSVVHRGEAADAVARATVDAIVEHTLAPTRLSRVDLVTSPHSTSAFRAASRALLREPRPAAPALSAMVTTRAPSMRAALQRAARTAEDDLACLEHLLEACSIGLLGVRESLPASIQSRVPSDAIGVATWLRGEVERCAATEGSADLQWAARGFGDVRALLGLERAVAVQGDDRIALRRTRYRLLYRMASSPWLADGGTALLRSLVPEAPPSSAEVSTAPGPTAATHVRAPSGTPTSRLRELLEQQLGPRERAHLLAEVDRDRGLRGDDAARLTEYLLHADPAAVLRDHFTAAHLAELAESQAGLDPGAAREPRRAALAILRALGFSVAEPPEGLSTWRRKLEALREDAARARDTIAVVGCVAQGGHVVERMLKRLLLFQSRRLFDLDADDALRKIGALDAREVVARASLGKLLYLVFELERHLRMTDELAAKRYRALHGERSLLYRKDTDLASMRNVFAHDREALEGRTLGELRTLASRFFEEACSWIDHLQEPVRLYPVTVTITGEEVDRWGRRLVRCTTDEGRDEALHTDHALAIGARYFMHPTSNPIRVFPLLVSAEDAPMRQR